MARILSIDYGTVRTGIAVTDPLKIIANPLETVPTDQLMEFLEKYFRLEEVECIVVGDPKNLDNTPAAISHKVNAFIDNLNEKSPAIPIKRIDERFTSKIATQVIIASGIRKKARRDKSLVDKISAVIILQSYLDTIQR